MNYTELQSGMTGYKVTKKEMKKATLERFSNTKYCDLAIPLGNKTLCEKHEEEFPVYWERENGSHGWACPNCGAVLQWG